MLKSESLKKLLVIMLAVILLVLIQAPVQATSPIPTNNSAGTGNGIQNIPTINQPSNNTANTANTTNNVTNVPSINNGIKNNTSNTNKSNYTNTSSLPKAGVDYSVLFVIVACVASGIYAYIKIRDYNNIKY